MLKALSNSLFRPSFLLVACATVAPSALASDYSFLVTNNTRTNIVKIQTQMLGGPWGDFDLGGAIRPGKSVELNWAETIINRALSLCVLNFPMDHRARLQSLISAQSPILNLTELDPAG